MATTQSSYDLMATVPPPAPRVFLAPKGEPTPLAEIIEALQIITPLQGLSDAEYEWIALHGTEYVGTDGAILFVEGGPCDRMHLILKGEIHVRRGKGSAAQIFIGRAGQMTGKIPFSRMKTYGGDGYCVGSGWSMTIHEDMFPAMLAAIPSMTQRCVSVLLDRTREVTRMEQQGEKLIALGKLAGNLAHELNNPASAAQRAAASLFGDLKAYGGQRHALGRQIKSPEQDAALTAWYERTREQMCDYCESSAGRYSAIAVADREDALAAWLDDHQVPNAWSLAPSLAESPLTIAQLDELAGIASPELLALGIPAFAMSLRVERMAETVIDSTVRIFDLISAIKDYSYMDQAPIQDVDLAESIESTLAVMQSQLEGVKVVKEFDPMLPRISAYGSELNQVWTVLIENALEAMEDSKRGDGVLRLTTRLSGQSALVEIWDNGNGIPEELRSRVFEPFFTTKAPGRGLGLGLDTAQRIVNKHSGSLSLKSKPGETCFQVRLPLHQAQAY
jgi:signal transduction histidine kinase